MPGTVPRDFHTFMAPLTRWVAHYFYPHLTEEKTEALMSGAAPPSGLTVSDDTGKPEGAPGPGLPQPHLPGGVGGVGGDSAGQAGPSGHRAGRGPARRKLAEEQWAQPDGRGFKSCLCTYLCDFEQSVPLSVSASVSLSVKWGTCHSQVLL